MDLEQLRRHIQVLVDSLNLRDVKLSLHLTKPVSLVLIHSATDCCQLQAELSGLNIYISYHLDGNALSKAQALEVVEWLEETISSIRLDDLPTWMYFTHSSGIDMLYNLLSI